VEDIGFVFYEAFLLDNKFSELESPEIYFALGSTFREGSLLNIILKFMIVIVKYFFILTINNR
jgi:hypothetical protein